MSVRSFGSVYMVGGVAAAALGCYLVSLRVASERAALESVENEIVLAQRDIRLLQTEIGTRGRLAQLERWNVKVLALSAPSADQFIPDSFQLARLATPERRLDAEAPVVYASAPAAPSPGVLPASEEQGTASAPAARMMHEASLKLPTPRMRVQKAAPPKAAPVQTVTAKPKQAATKPVQTAVSTSMKKPSPDRAKAKAAPTRLAQADPLAPLAAAGKKVTPAPRSTSPSTSKASPSSKASPTISKDSGQTR
ncbi:MAG: hypothetical protein WKF52_09275 [Sphingomicrobium sp.]